MKMNYLQKSKNNTRNIFQTVGWGFALFSFFILIRLFFIHATTEYAYAISRPLWSTRDTVLGAGDSVHVIDGINAGDVQALRSEIYNLQLRNMELAAEVTSLHGQIHVTEIQNEKNRLTAKVVSQPPFTPYDVFIINVGSADGVVLGTKIYIGNNTLVGTITKLENTNSEVTLLSSGSQTTQSRLLRTGEGVILNGNGGGNFEVTVPKGFDIVVGDMFVDGTVSQHVIAQVFSIDESSKGSFKKIYAKIPVNIFQTIWVGVEK